MTRTIQIRDKNRAYTKKTSVLAHVKNVPLEVYLGCFSDVRIFFWQHMWKIFVHSVTKIYISNINPSVFILQVFVSSCVSVLGFSETDTDRWTGKTQTAKRLDEKFPPESRRCVK